VDVVDTWEVCLVDTCIWCWSYRQLVPLNTRNRRALSTGLDAIMLQLGARDHTRNQELAGALAVGVPAWHRVGRAKQAAPRGGETRSRNQHTHENRWVCIEPAVAEARARGPWMTTAFHNDVRSWMAPMGVRLILFETIECMESCNFRH
jgi:hypothetical protein